MLWRILEVKYLQYIAFKIVPAKGMLRVGSFLQPPCDTMNPVAQTKRTSGELRDASSEFTPPHVHGVLYDVGNPGYVGTPTFSSQDTSEMPGLPGSS